MVNNELRDLPPRLRTAQKRQKRRHIRHTASRAVDYGLAEYLKGPVTPLPPEVVKWEPGRTAWAWKAWM